MVSGARLMFFVVKTFLCDLHEIEVQIKGSY